MSSPFAQRLTSVNDRIERATLASDRDPSEITLIAVSKTFSAQAVSDAVRSGAVHLGENRVQEAHAKKPETPPATWHLIGPLQRNKVRPALETFDVIHTLDRPRLATRLQRLLEESWPNREVPVLIEINIANEEQKSGIPIESAEDLLRATLGCNQLRPIGLMAIPPISPDPEATRPYFHKLRLLRHQLQDSLGHPLPHLSMGMSCDFEVAIQEGATMVRVGTALFGERS
ncbi:MAG: YggS family pyridoxal phosphate-dependent enzyme [bacterium]|nr:YggS family pyridoxal phosphate-dependent enzyme [bacterium]